jgi:ribonuclease HI
MTASMLGERAGSVTARTSRRNGRGSSTLRARWAAWLPSGFPGSGTGSIPQMAASPRRRSKPLPGHLPEAAPGEVLIWTDGACQRNPGPGGWAALVCWQDGVVEQYSGELAHTTNNIMEMTAALEGLRALPSGSRACVVTDSRYLHDGMTSWMAGWKRKGWKTASGDPVKNKEIWVQLDAAASDHEQVRWHWVKGHVGHALNERADLLAVAATHNAARSVL